MIFHICCCCFFYCLIVKPTQRLGEKLSQPKATKKCVFVCLRRSYLIEMKNTKNIKVVKFSHELCLFYYKVL